MIIYKKQAIKKAQQGTKRIYAPITPADSLTAYKDKILKYEAARGSSQGTPLPFYASDPTYKKYLDSLEQDPVVQLFPTAQEKAEAMDFMFNSGKDPRVYMLDEYLRKTTGQGLPNRVTYNARKYSFNPSVYPIRWTPDLERQISTLWEQHGPGIMSQPQNARRIILNKGRDNYYQNLDRVNGELNPAYANTWYGRIWNTNDLRPFDPQDSRFTPKQNK